MNTKTLTEPLVLEPLPDYREYPESEMRERALWFCEDIARRRTVREFDSRSVPKDIIEQCLLSAATAPSGANQHGIRFNKQQSSFFGHHEPALQETNTDCR